MARETNSTHGMRTCIMAEKRRLVCRFLEAVVLIAIILAIWAAMFLPVAIYFMPQPRSTGSLGITQQNSTMMTTAPLIREHSVDMEENDTVITTMLQSTEPPLDSEENNSATTEMISCHDVVNANESSFLPNCRENFFSDLMDGGHCKPKCSSWSMFSWSTQTASQVVIGSATVIGILTTVVVIILSFTHFKSMLEFPSVLIIYQDIIMSVHGLLTLIGLADRRLFCTSDNLIESYNNSPSSFCTISGVVSSYIVYPLTIWIAIQVGYTLLAVRAPFYFKRLSKKRKIGHCLSLLIGVVSLLIPSMITLGVGGFSTEDTIFPPIVCWANNRDLTVYTLLIPMGLMLSIIDTLLVLILHFLLRNRCINKNSSKELKKAEIKVLIICCCYVLLGLATMLGYSMSSVTLSELQRELFAYFECERCGVRLAQACDRSGFERLTNPPLITIAYSLLALYPVITLIYFLRIKRKPRIKQALPDVTSKTSSL